MKKILIWVVCIFFATPCLKAQTDTTENDSLSQFIENWKNAFHRLDKNQITTGMLKEYGMIPLSFAAYNGQSDSVVDI